MNKNLLALSVAAASAMAFSASAAVSSNIVGYVKLTLKRGLNLVANPLNNTNADGNKVSKLFPIDCSVLRWTGSGFVSTDIAEGGIVLGGVDFDLAPGTSVFVDNTGAADSTVTLVGDALVGTQVVDNIVGNNFVASKIPLAGTATQLNLKPSDGDTVLKWVNGTGYVAYDSAGGGIWLSGEPSLAVGEGIVLQATAVYAWSLTFNPAP